MALLRRRSGVGAAHLCLRGDRDASRPHANLAATENNAGAPSMAPNSLLVLALISLSAGADSLGFIHASKIWQQEKIQVECWQPLANGQRPLTRYPPSLSTAVP